MYKNNMDHLADRKAIRELESTLRNLPVDSEKFQEVKTELLRKRIQYREKYRP